MLRTIHMYQKPTLCTNLTLTNHVSSHYTLYYTHYTCLQICNTLNKIIIGLVPSTCYNVLKVYGQILDVNYRAKLNL